MKLYSTAAGPNELNWKFLGKKTTVRQYCIVSAYRNEIISKLAMQIVETSVTGLAAASYWQQGVRAHTDFITGITAHALHQHALQTQL